MGWSARAGTRDEQLAASMDRTVVEAGDRMILALGAVTGPQGQ